VFPTRWRLTNGVRYAHLSSAYLRTVASRPSEEVLIVAVNQIASIVADGELLNITTIKNERHVITYRLKDLEQRLDPDRLVRLGRGTLANIDLIKPRQCHAWRHPSGIADQRSEAAGQQTSVQNSPGTDPEALNGSPGVKPVTGVSDNSLDRGHRGGQPPLRSLRQRSPNTSGAGNSPRHRHGVRSSRIISGR
jgi:LytTr DNA-binding domain-containing protein